MGARGIRVRASLNDKPSIPTAIKERRRIRRTGLTASVGVMIASSVAVIARRDDASQFNLHLQDDGSGLVLGAAIALSAVTIFSRFYSVEYHKSRLYLSPGPNHPISSFTAASPCTSVVTKDTSDGRGRGAFAAEHIERGTFLGCYDGELIDIATYWSRYGPSGVSDYCMQIDQDWLIDGEQVAKESIAFTPAHINHSASRFNVIRKYLRREKRIELYVCQDVEKGDELLLNYGKRYWTGRENQIVK